MSADASGDLMPEHAVRIMLRPVASSPPLGFFAYAGGTVLLTALELNLRHQVQQAGQEPGVRRQL